jgi:outer membrane receptor protein involved in Fe transport
VRDSQARRRSKRFSKTPLAAAIMLISPGLMAQALEEVVVTAQKRSQNMQDVPISIQALGTEAIAELGIQNFADYPGLRLQFYQGLYARYRNRW